MTLVENPRAGVADRSKTRTEDIVMNGTDSFTLIVASTSDEHEMCQLIRVCNTWCEQPITAEGAA